IARNASRPPGAFGNRPNFRLLDTMNQREDGTLVMPLLDDEKAEVDGFSQEALAHLDAMYGVACKLTRNPTEAEDLMQDAFVKAMRARDQFNAGTNLKAWLFRILTHTLINKYRRGGLERAVLDRPDAQPPAA